MGPWLDASPESIYLTLYHEVKKLGVRASAGRRPESFTTYPVAGYEY